MRPLFSRLAGHKPQDTRSAAYIQSKSNKPTWGGRSSKSRDINDSITDIHPFAKDQEASYRSYIPLEEVARGMQLEKSSLHSTGPRTTSRDEEEARE